MLKKKQVMTTLDQ